MKKLKLKSSLSHKGEALTRTELKSVLGGDENGSGSGSGSNFFCQCANGNSFTVSAPSQSQAMEFANYICGPVIHCSPSYTTP